MSCKECQNCVKCEIVGSGDMNNEKCKECQQCVTCQLVGGYEVNAHCKECQNCITCQLFGETDISCKALQNVSCKPQQQAKQVKLQFGQRRIGEITLWNTGKCNFACDYCFSYKIYGKEGAPEMSDDLINALPDFIEKYVSPNGGIWFFGAEPLMGWNSIKKIYELVHPKFPNLRFGMTTNGSILKNDNIAKWLGERNFGILFSMDGWDKSHNAHRKYHDGSPTFEDVFDGLMNTRLYINNQPQIRWTYTPDTVCNLSEDFDNFVKMGLTTLACEPVYEVPWSEDDLALLKKQMQLIGERIIYLARHGTVYNVKPMNDVISMLNTTQANWNMRCGLVGQGGTVGVDVDGKIYPCHRFVAGRDEADVLGTLKTGIDWSKVDALRTRWAEFRPYSEYGEEHCFACPNRTACAGGCIAVNKDTTKDWHVMPKAYCNIQRTLFDALVSYAQVFRAITQNQQRGRQSR